MLLCLRQLEAPRGARGRKLRIGAGRLPVRDLIQFLESSGDEQVEIAKRCLWKISFNSPLFPPSSLFRRILSLQTEEKGLDAGTGHRSRDHIRHLIYLSILGIYLFSIDANLQRRFDRQATHQKRRHRVGAFNNIDLFVQSWLAFCIFHDIGYPIERLHSAENPEVLASIERNTLSSYQDLGKAYGEEYTVRAVANLCALVALLEFDDHEFGDLVLPHLDDAKVDDLKKALKTSKVSYDGVRRAKPIALFSPPYARLVGALIGRRALLAVMESEATGRIVWMGNQDRSIDLHCDGAVDARAAWQQAYAAGPEPLSGYSIKYYPCASLTAREVVASVLPARPGANADIQQICKELLKRDDFRRGARTAEALTVGLSSVAYGALCGTDFMSHSLDGRFEDERGAEVARAAVGRHAGEVIEQLARSFELALRQRWKDKVFPLEDVLSTSKASEAYEQLTRQALEHDDLMLALSRRLAASGGGALRGAGQLRAAVEEVRERFEEDSRMQGTMAKSLQAAVKPMLEEAVARERAINRTFTLLMPAVQAIVDQATTSVDMADVAGLAKADPASPGLIRELFVDHAFGRSVDMLTEQDRALLADIGKDYKPTWRVDHGFYAAAIALWSSCLRLSMIRASRDGSGTPDTEARSRLACLMTFNPAAAYQGQGAFADSEAESEALRSATDLCYRSIALHNFYPKLSLAHRHLQHAIGSHAFTYIALLCDALQNWDRDVQYNPGKFDLTDLKPDGMYDIFLEGDRLCVVIDRSYFTEARIVALRKDLASYLRDLDTIVEIRLG
ncbi:hypothetical protein [Roseateles sp. L2-2]|uniref:hypothetical protein n=1 Tax=Roseateles sp. L2-2 TaxID=3422597 RepID=UPI003D3682E6